MLRAAHDRVQHRERVLEDHRDPVAAESGCIASAEPQRVAAVEKHLAAGHLHAGGEEPDQRAGCQRLATAGLPDDRDGLPAVDIESDPVDQRSWLLSPDVGNPQGTDGQELVLRGHVSGPFCR